MPIQLLTNLRHLSIASLTLSVWYEKMAQWANCLVKLEHLQGSNNKKKGKKEKYLTFFFFSVPTFSLTVRDLSYFTNFVSLRQLSVKTLYRPVDIWQQAREIMPRLVITADFYDAEYSEESQNLLWRSVDLRWISYFTHKAFLFVKFSLTKTIDNSSQ